MNSPSEPTIQANTQIRDFINDIVPIFRGRDVFIADVGAHVGSTFAAFYQSPLKVNRACLFEANPKNFEKLEQCVAQLDAGEHATCLHIAVSDKAGKVILHDMQDMSRIIGSDPQLAEQGDQRVFEIDAKPLDDFRTLFPDGHISILKIDVEGHELEVFRGAQGLLADHAVEVVYVEAGIDRENAQQTHYRDVEDLLQEHGYGLFKIYEQTMEWVDDRPLLRRMNMAFVSPIVATKYPYSILKELTRLDNKLEAKNKEIDELRREVAIKNAALAETNEKLKKAHEELAVLARAVSELDRNDPRATLEHGAAASRLAAAERRVRELESSTSWKITAPLRKLSDRMRRR